MVEKTKRVCNPHSLSALEKRAFQRMVYRHGSIHYRNLPWRFSRNSRGRKPTPYRVLVSEIMLQQTQADRVAPKYVEFCRKFPTVRALASASLADVLVLWQGLGYNRRARSLWECARIIEKEHNGRVPRTEGELAELPGIGPYTAGAVCAFAFNEPAVFIETNIRTVYIHHFFPDASGISDKQLLPLVEATLDAKHPCAWYTALFDYGAHLKATGRNAGRRSAHTNRQSSFKGSHRQLRGAIVRKVASGPQTLAKLSSQLGQSKEKIAATVDELKREGIVDRHRQRVSLASD